MKKSIGPVVIIDTNPPYREWDGNQATYLFFPVFTSFLLVLIATLSEPIIDGLSVVHVDTKVNGTITFGAWGWCSHGVPGVENKCSENRAFGSSMEPELSSLPPSIQTLADISTAIPASYLIANGVFHVLSALATWMTTTWTLAASGSWHNKQSNAWDWTKWSFGGTFWSALLILIAWGMDLGMVGRVGSKAIAVDNSQPSVTPGPSIWMMMVAFLLNLITFIVRMVWLKQMPRPVWSIKGAGGDFHNAMPPPMSAALPPPDDQPPTWESLAIDAITSEEKYNPYDSTDHKVSIPLDDTTALEQAIAQEHQSINQRGFAV